jgi:Ca2+-binding RTX toxin-like protein
MQAKTTTLQPGDSDEITVNVRNSGGAGSLQTHLLINLPTTVTLLGAPYFERGSGCTGTQSIDCFLDYIPNGETTKVVLEVRVSGNGAQTVIAKATSDREADPSDNSASLTLQVGTPLPTPQPPTPTPPTPHGKTIVGTARADRLVGTPYADVIKGLGGNDHLIGGKGDDQLYGGTGNDLIEAGPGHDHVDGGPGNDTIRARDGQRDVIICGSGRDVVYADSIDKLVGCEVIHRS